MESSSSSDAGSSNTLTMHVVSTTPGYISRLTWIADDSVLQRPDRLRDCPPLLVRSPRGQGKDAGGTGENAIALKPRFLSLSTARNFNGMRWVQVVAFSKWVRRIGVPVPYVPLLKWRLVSQMRAVGNERPGGGLVGAMSRQPAEERCSLEVTAPTCEAVESDRGGACMHIVACITEGLM